MLSNCIGFSLNERNEYIYRYRPYMEKYPMLETNDIDVKIIYKNHLFENIEKILELINIIYDINDENFDMKIFINKKYKLILTDYIDFMFYNNNDIPVIKSYMLCRKIDLRQVLEEKDEYKCTSIYLTKYNILYLYVLLNLCVQNKIYDKRIHKCGSIFTRYYMIIGAYIDDDENIRNFFIEIENFNNELNKILTINKKMEFLYSNYNYLKNICLKYINESYIITDTNLYNYYFDFNEIVEPNVYIYDYIINEIFERYPEFNNLDGGKYPSIPSTFIPSIPIPSIPSTKLKQKPYDSFIDDISKLLINKNLNNYDIIIFVLLLINNFLKKSYVKKD